MSDAQPAGGHRERLRERFVGDPASLTDAETIELLLTFAIPRQDVAPLAQALLARFGGLAGLLAASYRDLLTVPGIGPHSAMLIRLAAALQAGTGAAPEGLQADPGPNRESDPPAALPSDWQPPLPLETADPEPLSEEEASEPDLPVRTYTNDLIQTALAYLPQALRFDDLVSYRAHLLRTLPYNSSNSRRRYTSNLLARYFAYGTLQTPLMDLLRYGADEESFKAALLYETTCVEPALQLVTEEVVWPALPAGFLTREQLKERVIALFPAAGPATIQRMLLSLVNTYTLLGVMEVREGVLRLQQRRGTSDAFVYVLAAQFPEPGAYSIERLENGPGRRWLLWDRGWMRRQLYGLDRLNLLAKVSEIDALRQFSLSWSREELMRYYYTHPQRHELALRDAEPSL